MATIPVNVPDIGDASDVDVVEILVQPGTKVEKEQSLIVLESEKASMEIPSPSAGVVAEVKLSVGDKVSKGSLILILEDGVNATAVAQAGASSVADGVGAAGGRAGLTDGAGSAPSGGAAPQATKSAPASPARAARGVITVEVPDIGDASDVDVVEVLVRPGTEVEKEQSLIVLESDKASMEIPSPGAGVVVELKLGVGDKVSAGSPILTMEPRDAAVASPASATAAPEREAAPAAFPSEPTRAVHAQADGQRPAAESSSAQAAGGRERPHATPSVRKLARELGVDLSRVPGTGPHGRITREDVQGYVKQAMTGATAQTGSGFAFPPAPTIDFSQFGEVSVEPLTKIQKLSGQNLHRSWVTVPHVTQFDQADITELEAFRKQLRAERSDVKMTMLPFLMKALVVVLKRMPRFNASLDPSGEKLIMKRYFHVGVAVDTANGLVVPVIRDVHKKGLIDLALELAEVSERARARKLSPKDLQGASMSISSLGGIGGTAFTPILNPPEVGILGVSRAEYQPVYKDGAFVPRLMCPLSLSYDHRVIDGAYAVRFTTALRQVLSDIRQMLL